jgi:cytochrome b subunit of formate dehydrogenase
MSGMTAERDEQTAAPAGHGTWHILRFTRYQRILHGFLMLSFLGLAGTGLPLLFSEAEWAHVVARLWGGFAVAGLLHRFFALILITVFILHVWGLIKRLYVQKELSVLWGPASMVPQPRDVIEMIRHFRWFFGVGPRPRFDHFTYWEKFDYWAVFWGMGIIGGSGFLLWFPEFFASFLPGWMFNVAMLVHGEEALLAVGFIFTIHFFNGHLRPDKFPMDLVIFTGRVDAHEFAVERQAEHERLVAEGRLEAHLGSPPSDTLARGGRILGSVAVTVGLSIVGLILYAVFF